MLKTIVASQMNPPLNTVLITDIAGLGRVKEYLERTTEFTLDVETNTVENVFERKIRTIQLGDKYEQYVIDLLALAGSSAELVAGQGNFGAKATVFKPLIDLLVPHLESDRCVKVGTNLQFDYEVLFWCLGIRAWHFYDCLLAEKTIYAGLVHFMAKGYWGLDDMVGRYCGLEMNKSEQCGFDFETPLTPSQIEYCGLDCRMPMAVRVGQMRTIENDKLEEAAEVEFDTIPAMGDMALFGFGIDKTAWNNLLEDTKRKQQAIVAGLDKHFLPIVGYKHITDQDRAELLVLEAAWRDSPNKTPEQKAERLKARLAFMERRKEITAKTKLFDECEGEAAINYGGNAQLKKALWRMDFTKGDLPDTNDKTLEKLADIRKLDIEKALAFDVDTQQWKLQSEYTVIDLIRLYRTTSKNIGTYGLQWIQPYELKGHLNPYTDRIHSNINQYGAATARMSSSSPNVQNIPRGSAYRSCFVPAPGKKFIDVDMSGAELRILAELSGEPIWVEAFDKKWDVHSVGASIAFQFDWVAGTEPGCAFVEGKKKCNCKVHKNLRDSRAKIMNFKLAYGGEPGPDEMGIPRQENGKDIPAKERDDRARAIVAEYKKAFPIVMAYLEKSGNDAAMFLESRAMDGHRRRWKRVSWEDAKKRATEDCQKNNLPLTEKRIKRAYGMMQAAIKREGKNNPIQSMNAVILKKAIGCGKDRDGNKMLWHTLWPKYKARLCNVVHDETVTESDPDKAEAVRTEVCLAYRRAAACWMTRVVMESEGKITDVWSK